MASGPGRVTTDSAWARPGDLAFYAGPERMQAIVEALGSRWAHIGIVVDQDGRLFVLEVGLKGVQLRSLKAILRHYGKIGVARLPIDGHLASELANHALEYLDSDLKYGHPLAKLQYLWSILRSVNSKHTAKVSRLLLPAVAVLAKWFSRDSATTCSAFVHRALADMNLDALLDLRFDRALPDGVGSGWKAHQRLAGGLCGPGDVWCCNRVTTTMVECTDGELVISGSHMAEDG